MTRSVSHSDANPVAIDAKYVASAIGEHDLGREVGESNETVTGPPL